jgi:hypothetical protein
MLFGVHAWAGFVRSLKLDPQDESALFMITPVLILIFFWWLFGLFKEPGDDIATSYKECKRLDKE